MPKPCSGHSPRLNVGVAVTSGDDQDHPAAEGTMVLVLSAIVPWAFRNAKAFQGIDQEAGEARCSLAIALGQFLHKYLGTKGTDGTYYYNMERVQVPWVHDY